MSAMDSDIGGRLRRARESHGLSLRDAATQTKLSIQSLKAIERNDFASLPDGLYRRAYIRTLAAEFGLDANELAADYRASYEPPIEPPAERDGARDDRLVQQLNSPRRSIGMLAVLATLTAAWFWLYPDSAQPGARVGDTAGQPLLLQTMPSPEANLNVHALPGAVTRVSAVDRPSGVPLRVEMAATAWCWIAAESDGDRVLYRLVEPGERVVVEGRRMISLRLGNAGSVTLSINDGPRRSAGGDGEVVDLTLTPDNADALRDGAVETVSGD
jgi:cytoskeleton protein RodZ